MNQIIEKFCPVCEKTTRTEVIEFDGESDGYRCQICNWLHKGHAQPRDGGKPGVKWPKIGGLS